jgi:hypothetical protein
MQSGDPFFICIEQAIEVGIERRGLYSSQVTLPIDIASRLYHKEQNFLGPFIDTRQGVVFFI